MASKKKNHYYVLVISNNGPVFVTKVNNANKTAEWNCMEKPMEFNKYWAEDLVLGLNLNFHKAFLVSHPIEIDCQPYNYEGYKVSFVERESEDGDDK